MKRTKLLTKFFYIGIFIILTILALIISYLIYNFSRKKADKIALKIPIHPPVIETDEILLVKTSWQALLSLKEVREVIQKSKGGDQIFFTTFRNMIIDENVISIDNKQIYDFIENNLKNDRIVHEINISNDNFLFYLFEIIDVLKIKCSTTEIFSKENLNQMNVIDLLFRIEFSHEIRYKNSNITLEIPEYDFGNKKSIGLFISELIVIPQNLEKYQKYSNFKDIELITSRITFLPLFLIVPLESSLISFIRRFTRIDIFCFETKLNNIRYILKSFTILEKDKTLTHFILKKTKIYSLSNNQKTQIQKEKFENFEKNPKYREKVLIIAFLRQA